MRIIKIGLSLAASATAITTGLAAPASAATTTPTSAGKASGQATVTPSLTNTCSYGSDYGKVSSTLTNGTLTTGFCRYGTGAVAQVNTEYQKTGGSCVTLRFAWEWTNAYGSSSYGRRYDNGAFTECPNQDKYFAWKYPSPGIYSPSANAPCLRGVLVQYSNGTAVDTYSTAVIC